jgi:hypothetical protein
MESSEAPAAAAHASSSTRQPIQARLDALLSTNNKRKMWEMHHQR